MTYLVTYIVYVYSSVIRYFSGNKDATDLDILNKTHISTFPVFYLQPSLSLSNHLCYKILGSINCELWVNKKASNQSRTLSSSTLRLYNKEGKMTNNYTSRNSFIHHSTCIYLKLDPWSTFIITCYHQVPINLHSCEIHKYCENAATIIISLKTQEYMAQQVSTL